MYAIVETGGKQYRVAPGEMVNVDYLDAIDGSPVELDRVLLIADGEHVTNGSPTVEGARVLATSQGEVRGDKTICFKYKSKTRYRRKVGHRQTYTRLAIDQIVTAAGAEGTEQEVSKNGA